jgi:methyl-accepting chemotaxis protein
MTSRKNIIDLIEKCLQKVIAQEDIENNVNLINKNIKDLELDVSVREFLLYLIKTIKSLSESKSNFSKYPFTEIKNSPHQRYQEESKKNIEDIIRKLTDEINKIISAHEIKDFELIIKNTFNQITDYRNKNKQIIELLLSEIKNIEILKSENLLVGINPDLNNFKVKYKTELNNKEEIKKSYEKLKKDTKEIKLISDINSEKSTKLKKDNILISGENQKLNQKCEEINDEYENLKNSIQQIKDEIVQMKNYNDKADNKIEKIITENKQIKSSIQNMEKQINELYNMNQENEYNNKRMNIDIYILQREIEELKKEKMEFQNDYLLMSKYIDEIIEKRCDEVFNKYYNEKNNK